MANVQYTIDFVTLRKEEPLRIEIYGAVGGARVLDGAATPIITEEDNNPDIFTPVRAQSGYISIVDTGQAHDGLAFDWHTLLPEEALERPVVLKNSSTGTVYWKGFIQNQQPENAIYELPVERSYAIYDILGALDFVDFNTGINTATTNAYVNFAYLINRIMDMLPSEVKPANYYFQGGNDVKQHLLSKVNPMLFCEVSDTVEAGEDGTIGYEQNISQLRPKYRCREVLEEICKFWGWSCRTYNGDLYFVRDVAPGTYQGTDHAPYLKVTPAQLAQLAAGTSAGTSEDNPSEYTYNGSELVSTENSLTDKKPIGYVAVRADAGPYKELMKLFPERPRMAIASHVKWNGGSAEFPPLRISQTAGQYNRYWVDSHIYLCTIGTNYPGDIFGFRSEAEKWGTGDKYTYTYVAGAMFGNPGAGKQMKLMSRWPFNFQDCRLSMKATFFKEDGAEYKETYDDTDVFGNIGKGYADIVLAFIASSGTTYYWNGDSFQLASTSFSAYVGGSDGYIYPKSAQKMIDSAQNYYRPRKYITFESLTNNNIAPVGRIEIYFNDVWLTSGSTLTGGMGDLVVEVERTQVPSVYDSVKEENTYLPVNGPRHSLPLEDDWSEDTIFASDDCNQFGIGTVLNPDNTPMVKPRIDAGISMHPEAWVAAMVYEFGRQPRKILCTEMNRGAASVEAITPRRRMSYLYADWLPFSISHYWRDDIKKIYAINVKQGTMQVTIIVQAGTGIASVSPSGSNQVYYGGNIYLSCVVQTSPNRYIFSHWQNSQGVVVSRQQNFTLANITSGDTITAVAELDTTQYTVTIITNAAGVSSVTGAGTYTFGTEKQISCAVASGYRFLAWTEGSALGEVISNSNPFTLVVNRDITLYPQTEPEGGDSWFMYFAIQQPSWGHIEDNDDPPSVFNDRDWYEFIDGEAHVFRAVPASGYEFVKWLFNGEDFTGNTNQEITWDFDPAEDADGTLTAVFQEAPAPPTSYTLTLKSNIKDARITVEIGSSAAQNYDFPTVSTEHQITVPAGSTVKITASYNGFSTVSFIRWWDDDYTEQWEMPTANPYTFSMSKNKTFTCVFN